MTECEDDLVYTKKEYEQLQADLAAAKERIAEAVLIKLKIASLIQKYIGSSLKTVELCIRQYSETKKYQPFMKTRGELEQILRALKKGGEQE